MMMPIMGTMASMMRIILKLGIYDTPFFLLTSIGGFGGGLLIYRTAFRNVPWEFAESGYIDGAGHFKVFYKLMFPQIYPLFIAQVVGGFIGVWNDTITPLLYFPSYPTLASGLYVYQIEQARSLHTPVLFAGCILCALPTLILFLSFQKFMMNIDLSGGIKG